MTSILNPLHRDRSALQCSTVRSTCRCGGLKLGAALILTCIATAITLRAQTFTTLANFDGQNGPAPVYGPLVQGLDGGLYGTASGGGDHSSGFAFRLTTAGILSTLH